MKCDLLRITCVNWCRVNAVQHMEIRYLGKCIEVSFVRSYSCNCVNILCSHLSSAGLPQEQVGVGHIRRTSRYVLFVHLHSVIICCC